ncbi:MAG: hemerythrin domain-containing protein [Micrococcales bacterium]|nr:hemerythrin domain-containing protein [Micrococcales bacterium]
MTFRTVTEYLLWDHDRLDATFAQVCVLAGRGEMPPAAVLFDRFHNLMMRHIRIEEAILMPVFEGKTGLTSGPTEASRREHKGVIEAIIAMKSALKNGSSSRFLEARRKFLSLLPSHHAKEETLMYPMIDQALTDEERLDLVTRLEEAI